MKTFRWLRLASLGAWVISGCAQPASHAQPPEPEAGGIQLGLDLSAGASLSRATYTITGPNDFNRSVVVMFGSSAKLSTFIGGTPPGMGYRLIVTGIASDGVSMCSGASAPFDVVGGQTTVVSLVLRCEEPEPTGSIQTSGSVNYCAAVDALAANPISAPVGGTIALASATHDKDGGPRPIAFAWVATAGTIDDPGGAHPTFTCTVAGPASLTLTVTDGDCGDSHSITVTCAEPGTAATPADAGAVSPDAGPPDASGPEAAVSPDPCLACESSSPQPACASRYNVCVTIPGTAAAGPAVGARRNDLCVDLISCVHATRCDSGSGGLRDCFCGSMVDEYDCQTDPKGPCRPAFYAAGESTNNATIVARLRNPDFALGIAAALVEQCEQKPEPLCGPWCGH